MAGIIICQHIPGSFSASFSKRLNDSSLVNVVEAKGGELIKPGTAYIAPGDMHLIIRKKNDKYYCVLSDADRVNYHKPSVSVMFDSVAKYAGADSMGIILTGMGSDGAEGLLKMKQNGAFTIAQDEKSSIIWGMPGTAVKLGAVDKEVSLKNIANEIIDYCNR